MRSWFRMLVVSVSIITILAALPAVTRSESPRLIVHEWGTFTSIAGADGHAVAWLPKSGPSDLPCFVYGEGALKYEAPSTVRMETPVLYFYSPIEQRVAVRVAFPQGRITEWFPDATGGSSGSRPRSVIEWQGTNVLPTPEAELRREEGPSHYYAARATDASVIEAKGEKEKFLFYRGVGSFEPPLAAIVRQDDRVLVWNASGEPLGDVVLFQRRGETTSFQVRRALTPQTTFDAPGSEADAGADVGAALERILTASGLFQKEAKAMVETWRDSWFEEGTRLIYVVPQATVDTLLPLSVYPSPNELARVFIGRIELVSRATHAEIRDALGTFDFTPLAKYGRFLTPFAELLLEEAPRNDHRLIRQRVAWALTPSVAQSRSCRR